MRESTTQNAFSSGEGKLAGPPEPRASRILVPCAVALVYFLTARLGLQFAMPGGHVTPVWPPSGLALAAMLLHGRRVWPGIWLGSFAANLWDFLHAAAPPPLAVSLLTAAGIGAGAAVAAWLGAELLQRYAGTEGPLARARNVCAFMGLGGVVSCLFSATNGVTWLALGGFAPWTGFGQIWLTWWLGDTAGVFLVTPLLLAWGAPPAFRRRRRWWEAAGCFALLLAATYSVFIANTTVLFSGKPFTFVLIPFLVWPALRFGLRGAATAAGLIAGVSVWGTIHGSGPFHLDSLNESLLVLELFLSVVALTALSLAAVVTEQRDAESDRRRVLDELESRVAERTAALDHANAALRASEHRLRTIIETEPECVKIVSPEGRLLEMNAAGLAMLDAARLEELTAQPLIQFIVPEYRPAFVALHQQVIAGGAGTLEFETLGLKGTRRWMETHAVPLREAAGQVTALLGVTRDVTRRKQAEAALRESEDRFRKAFEEGPLGIVMASLTDGRFIRANQAFCTLLGYPEEELLRLTFADVTHPEHRAVDAEAVRQLAAGQIQKHETEKRYLKKNGAEIWAARALTKVRSADGKTFYALAMIQDTTERKQAEAARRTAGERLGMLSRQLIETQEAERRHLARELHDEMGQTLTAAKLHLQALQRFPDPVAQPERLEKAVGLVDRLLEDVRNLSLNLRPPMLDDLGLVASLRWLLDQRARAAGLQVRFEYDAFDKRPESALETACFRVAQEALTNVVRHAQAQNVFVELRREPDGVSLLVRDDGAGFLVAGAQQRAGRGGSLGLLGMEERAALLGGTVRVNSTPGKGTEVRGWFPMGADREEPKGAVAGL